MAEERRLETRNEGNREEEDDDDEEEEEAVVKELEVEENGTRPRDERRMARQILRRVAPTPDFRRDKLTGAYDASCLFVEKRSVAEMCLIGTDDNHRLFFCRSDLYGGFLLACSLPSFLPPFFAFSHTLYHWSKGVDRRYSISYVSVTFRNRCLFILILRKYGLMTMMNNIKKKNSRVKILVSHLL